MNKPASKDKGYQLQAGLVLSVSPMGSRLDLAATIKDSSPQQLCLQIHDSRHHQVFKNGDPLWLKHWTDEGIACWTAILEKTGSGKDLQLFVKVQYDSGITLQRRAAHRYALKLPIAFTIAHPTERRVVSRRVFKSETISLSESGTRFLTHASVRTGDNLEIKIYLAESVEINVMARVVHLETVKHGRKTLNSAGVQFLGMMPEEQERLTTL